MALAPRFLTLPLAMLALAGPATRQSWGQSPPTDPLLRRIKSEEISLAVLLQGTGEYDPSPRSGSRTGFRVANARASLSGQLAHRRFGYLVQANFASSPALLDLRLGYHPTSFLALEVGQFKVPFSREALISAGELEFTERATVVTTLAPGRQVGGQIRAVVPGGGADLALGVFNGNGQGRATNDDDRVLVAGRIDLHPLRTPAPGLRLDLGLQGAISRDSAAPVGIVAASFNGRRRLLGGDLRVEWRGWLLAGEVIGSWLDFAAGPRRTPAGWYFTAGMMAAPQLQVLARWERFDSDGLAGQENLLLLGGQFRPGPFIRVRVHYGLPLGREDLGRHRLVGGMQVGF